MTSRTEPPSAGFLRGILPRMTVFAFLGLGWDVLMTLAQQLLSGKTTIHALCLASAWMYPVYATIPLLFPPVTRLLRRVGLPYPARLFCFLTIFYVVEFSYAAALARFSITAWNYGWYLPDRWNGPYGWISFHPAIVLLWAAFLALAEASDFALRRSQGALSGAVREFVEGL